MAPSPVPNPEFPPAAPLPPTRYTKYKFKFKLDILHQNAATRKVVSKLSLCSVAKVPEVRRTKIAQYRVLE